MSIRIDPDYLTNILAGLVKINSINPDLSNDGVGEAEIAEYVAEQLRLSGMEVQLQELAPKRYNVVGIRRGRGGGKSLMLNAHLDTVGINGMENPFIPEIQNDRLYGRGSQDMKGGLAAMLAVGRALQEAGVELSGDLIIAGVADEEYASMGTRNLIRQHVTDAAIVTEPTELRLCLAHRGFILYEIETFGRAAHGSRYKEGIDAIALMGRFIVRLEQLGYSLLEREPHPLVGPPSLHTSLIRGGTEASTYPAHCQMEFERRTCPGENYQKANNEIQMILNDLSNEDSNFKAALQPYLSRPPFEVSPQSEFVSLIREAMIDHLKSPVLSGGASFWTDAALLAEAGINSVLLGPTGQGLHSKEEWVDIKSCIDLAKILISLTTSYCR
jgi:acetylornithine deacetylase